MVIWLGWALAGGVDRVPEDFPTLQAAVDLGEADVISLGPGRWAGATVDRTVDLRARRGAVLDAGVRAGALQVGLWFVEGADGSRVDGLGFDCDAQLDGAVYSSVERGGLARGVRLEGLRICGCVQAVSIVGQARTQVDAGWSVSDSRFIGARTDALRGARGGGIGAFAYNVRGVEVVGNAFVGWSDDGLDFASAGVVVAGCEDCAIVGNRFATRGWQWGHASVVDAGETLTGGLPSYGLVVADNEATDGAWRGIDVRLHSSKEVVVEGNSGTVWRGR